MEKYRKRFYFSRGTNGFPSSLDSSKEDRSDLDAHWAELKRLREEGRDEWEPLVIICDTCGQQLQEDGTNGYGRQSYQCYCCGTRINILPPAKMMKYQQEWSKKHAIRCYAFDYMKHHGLTEVEIELDGDEMVVVDQK